MAAHHPGISNAKAQNRPTTTAMMTQRMTPGIDEKARQVKFRRGGPDPGSFVTVEK
jgi:hypothetical protein